VESSRGSFCTKCGQSLVINAQTTRHLDDDVDHSSETQRDQTTAASAVVTPANLDSGAFATNKVAVTSEPLPVVSLTKPFVRSRQFKIAVAMIVTLIAGAVGIVGYQQYTKSASGTELTASNSTVIPADNSNSSNSQATQPDAAKNAPNMPAKNTKQPANGSKVQAATKKDDGSNSAAHIRDDLIEIPNETKPSGQDLNKESGANSSSSSEMNTVNNKDSAKPVIIKPVILEQPKATYTEQARIDQIQGFVIVQVLLKADGTVSQPRVLRGLGHGLDEQAVNAAMKIRFTPAKSNDQNVDYKLTLSYQFSLY